MAKAKRLNKTKHTIKMSKKINGVQLYEFEVVKPLLNKKFIASALAEAILDADIKAVNEILKGVLAAQTISGLAGKSRLSRSTIYNAIDNKKLTVATLMKILKNSKF